MVDEGTEFIASASTVDIPAIVYRPSSNSHAVTRAIPLVQNSHASSVPLVSPSVDVKLVDYTLEETVSQADTAPPIHNPWRFEIRPYLEVPFAVNGRIEIDQDDDDDGDEGGGGEPPDPPIDLPPIELPFDAGFDLSDFFLLGGEVEIWYNDVGLYLEGFRADLGTRVLVGFRGKELIDSGVELSASYTRFAASLGWHVGTFSLSGIEAGADPETVFPAVRLELFGGAEYTQWSVGANLFDAVDLSLDPDWISPIVGANADFLINSRTSIFARGKVGGFNVGDAPSLILALQAGLDWEVLPYVSFRPSYIYRETQWEVSDNQIDLSTNGIWAGFSLNF
jgi:hypothetical protein